MDASHYNSDSIFGTFISFIIDGKQYGTLGPTSGESWSPDSITSLKVEKKTDESQNSSAGATFTIELNYLRYPDFYENLLTLMREYKDGLIPATLQYGLVNGNMSPLYELNIFSVEPNDLWTSLNITLKESKSANNIYDVFTEATKTDLANNEYYSVSDIVLAIASNQGWKIGDIVATKYNSEKISVSENIISPKLAIIDLLQRYPCESTLGEFGYISGFKQTLEGPVYYFVPTLELTKSYDFTNVYDTYEFFFNALPNGKVISFAPKFASALMEVSASGHNTTNNDSTNNSDESSDSNESEELSDNKILVTERPELSVVTKDSKEIMSIIYDLEDKKPLDSLAEPESFAGFVLSPQKAIYVDKPSLVQYMRSTINENINKYVSSVGVRTSAEMEVIGDPLLNVMDYIIVIPMYPQSNYTNPGKIHPTGGIYRITSLTDTLEGGQYTTSMKLMAVDNRNFSIGQISAATIDAIRVNDSIALISSEQNKEGGTSDA